MLLSLLKFSVFSYFLLSSQKKKTAKIKGICFFDDILDVYSLQDTKTKQNIFCS